PLCFDSLENDGWLPGTEGELVKDSIYTFNLVNAANADRFYWELPKGAVFADSLKWNSEAKLKFNSSFQQGDSIMVRSANRCHLGGRQFFEIQDFNGTDQAPQMIKTVYYRNGEIYLQFMQEIQEVVNYQIFNLQGQLIKSGELQNNKVKFQRKSELNLIRLSLNGESESFIF
ncbi:MAG: hypothetical protein GQ527_12160, partial [Bacteroidales bacterium]|nr:hypothetical protein [Bacteroidales bacterium]